MKTLSVRTVASMGLLFALAIVLSFLEHLIPSLVPTVPGIKLGLSNIVTMYALFYMGFSSALTIVGLKSLFVFLMRGATACFLSLAGGLLSLLIMAGLHRLFRGKLSALFLSVVGGVCHNLGQVLVASILLNVYVFLYLPVLLIVGVVMGLITGKLLQIVLPAMRRIARK